MKKPDCVFAIQQFNEPAGGQVVFHLRLAAALKGA